MSIQTILSQETASEGSPTTAAGGASPLDALLSPQGATFDPLPTISQESLTESELNEVVLDDVSESEFSSVPLTGRQSPPLIDSSASIKSTETHVLKEKQNRRRTTISLTPSDSSTLVKQSLHKKSGSNSSDKSIVGTTPFILARLESQKEQDESSPKTARGSVDGNQKLQEEFNRMHNEIKEEKDESHHNASIDWSMYLYIMIMTANSLALLS